MNDVAPLGWYPDPFGRNELRYWDGGQWTQHVGSGGRQGIDPPIPTSPVIVPTVAVPSRASKKIQRQAGALGVADRAQVGDEPLFSEPVLVVNQKGKLFEVKAEYAIYDQRGHQIAAVREVGQSVMKKALASANRTRRLQVVGMDGRVLLAMTQPTKILSSKMIVMGTDGTQIGQIVQKITLQYTRFRLESGGKKLGSIIGESRTDSDFSIQDATGNEVGRITRTSAGLAKALFTKADNYAVEIHRPLGEPLRSLVIAAALAVDTALRQR